MPSGAKKRKAAKKKKEQEANNNNNNTSSSSSTNTNPHGYDDSKSQDEKGSDGGEVSSPAHQDYHNNHHPFNEGSEEGDPSAVRSVVIEDKSMEKVPSGVEGVVKIERDLNPEEFGKESHDGNDGSSSSSSSSSDDESRATEKKRDKEANDSISDAISYTHVVKPVESSSAEKTQISETESEKLSAGVPETVTDFSPKKNEDKTYPLLDESAKSSPSVSESISKANEGNELPPSSAYIAQASNGTQRNKDSEIPESSENQPLVAPAPRIVQKTSWLSCCGIFDVVTGSSR